ncbi:MAG: ABC transporter permease [Bacillota bacterium]|nr:ABC transporter permease [Bacillota bacterium]
MNSRDLGELCLRNLFRRRTRTLLAIVGVVVGTCAIVVMLSIGFGLTQSYQEQIESYGNLHMTNVYSNSSGGNVGEDTRGALTEQVLETIKTIDGVDAVTPVISEYLTVGHGKKVASLEIVGLDADVLELFNYDVEDGGRLLEKTDKMGILFGNQVVYWFYDPNSNSYWSEEPEDVMSGKLILTGDWEYGVRNPSSGGDDIEYEEYDVKAVGVLSNPDDQSAYSAYMNIEDVEQIQKDLRKARKESTVQTAVKSYERAWVYVGDINKAADVSKVLREDLGLQAYNDGDWLESVKETTRMIQGILGGIGGISLLVAALGITNTMIMSIYERTKEIGIMKVIGANLQDIKRMFLLEAGLIGFLGGLAGVLLSLLLSLLMNTVLKDVIGMALGSIMGGGGSSISVIPWWLILVAIAFATGVGVAAGYYPARRAMNLSALESLRNE